MYHAAQVSGQHIEIDFFAQLNGKLRDHLSGVVTGPVEPLVDHGLYPAAQRAEQRDSSQHRDRDAEAAPERQYLGEHGDAPEIDPSHRSSHESVGDGPGDDPVDRVKPVLQDGDADGYREC